MVGCLGAGFWGKRGITAEGGCATNWGLQGAGEGSRIGPQDKGGIYPPSNSNRKVFYRITGWIGFTGFNFLFDN